MNSVRSQSAWPLTQCNQFIFELRWMFVPHVINEIPPRRCYGTTFTRTRCALLHENMLQLFLVQNPTHCIHNNILHTDIFLLFFLLTLAWAVFLSASTSVMMLLSGQQKLYVSTTTQWKQIFSGCNLAHKTFLIVLLFLDCIHGWLYLLSCVK